MYQQLIGELAEDLPEPHRRRRVGLLDLTGLSLLFEEGRVKGEWIGVLALGLLGWLYVNLRHPRLLWAMGGVVAFVVLGVLVEWLVVTERERVEETIEKAAAAVEANDEEKFNTYLTRDAERPGDVPHELHNPHRRAVKRHGIEYPRYGGRAFRQPRIFAGIWDDDGSRPAAGRFRSESRARSGSMGLCNNR